MSAELRPTRQLSPIYRLRSQAWLPPLHQRRPTEQNLSCPQSAACRASHIRPHLQDNLVWLQANSVLRVSMRSHISAVSVTAPRRCSQHSLDMISQCRQCPLNTKICTHNTNNSRRNNCNSHRRNRADSHMATVLLPVPYQMPERRRGSQHSRVSLVRATQLRSCRGNSSCPERRKRRKRRRGIPASQLCSLRLLSNGHRRTPSSCPLSSLQCLQIRGFTHLGMRHSRWTHDLCRLTWPRKCIHRVRQA